jgi:hypothetical protein
MPPKIQKKNRRQSKKPSRKPRETGRYCMDIISSTSIKKNRYIIEEFVKKLYSNKKYDDPFLPGELIIILDTNGKKVCIDISHKIKKIILEYKILMILSNHQILKLRIQILFCQNLK